MSEAIIDVHSHALFPASVKALGSEAGDMSLPSWTVEQHLETMDQNGIGVCVLSMPGAADGLNGAPARIALRKINDQFAALVARYPKRFGAFAAVPMDDMDAANEEMAYALDVLKLDGVCGSPHHEGVYLGEPFYDPWFAEMDRRATTLFVHPGTPPHFDPKESKLNVSVLEFMFETTRMVTTMVLSGAKQRFGKLNIIAPHGGGTFPYLAQRISLVSQMPWAYRGGPKISPADVTAALGSFYLDLTAATSETALDAIRHLMPSDRLLMGFDYPLMPPQTIAPVKATFNSYRGFDDSEKRNIAYGNAARLFPRFAMTKLTTETSRLSSS